MNAITVRNLPPELARVIRQKAKREKISLNRVVIDLLEDAMGLGRRAKPVEMSRILQGTPIPANDVWIAATAAQHGLRLLTLDAHFLRIPQVIVDFFGPVPPAQ